MSEQGANEPTTFVEIFAELYDRLDTHEARLRALEEAATSPRETIADAIRARRAHIHEPGYMGDCEDGCGWLEFAARIAEGRENLYDLDDVAAEFRVDLNEDDD